MTTSPEDISKPSSEKPRPRIGLALGSGAARGWAHVGVLRALDELGVEVDVYAGCSAGALVSAAKLLGILEDVKKWAKDIGPMGAVATFGLQLSRGGLINPEKAYGQFAGQDVDIDALPQAWGAVATDLATGQEVWMTEGSTLLACQASSAVPMVLQAVSYAIEGEEHWLIDGGVSNPVPISLARALGADHVIAVDLMASVQLISRFNRPPTREVVPVEAPEARPEAPLGEALETFLRSQQKDLARRFAMAKAKALSRPQFLETAIATIGIVQMQLSAARARIDMADVTITPNLEGLSPAAFDQHEAFEALGYEAAMSQRDALLALCAH